jgi:hypothetical protein
VRRAQQGGRASRVVDAREADLHHRGACPRERACGGLDGRLVRGVADGGRHGSGAVDSTDDGREHVDGDGAERAGGRLLRVDDVGAALRARTVASQRRARSRAAA